MNRTKYVISLLLIGMMLLGYVGRVEAEDPAPELASGFYGKVQFNDGDSGDPIEGDDVQFYYINTLDEEVLIYYTDIVTSGTDLVYAASVPEFITGASEGVDLIIKINNRIAAVKPWHAGTNVELNLHPPTCATTGPFVEPEGTPISFSGSSADLGNDVNAYEWDFDYTVGTFDVDSVDQNPTHTYTDVGSYNVSLRVTDANGGVCFSTTTANAVNVAPTNLLYTGQTTGSVGVAVNLSASATCASVDTCTFTWDLDNDSAYDDFTGSSTTYTWDTPGDKTIGIKVTDDDDSFATTTATITISLISQNINLVPGWNLISFSLIPADTTITSVLSSIASKYTIVYGWDGTVEAPNNWLKYDPALGDIDDPGNTLDNLDNKMGFWIKMTEQATLAIQGTIPTENTQIPLSTAGGGWNLVSYPSTLAGAPRETLPSSSFTLIYAYHKSDTSDPWKLFDDSIVGIADYANDLTQLTQGWGYWVKATRIDTWSVPY